MSLNLKAEARLIDDKMKFECSAGQNGTVVTDYTPPLGSGDGFTSLELFLMSVCSCVGGTMAVLLRSAGKSVDDITVCAEAKRRTEHPTCFESIEAVVDIKSPDASQDDINKALMLAEKSICPVAAMIKDSVRINYTARLI